MVFTSNDKLHAEIIPFFLKDHQSFIYGNDSKSDLEKIDAHYDNFPDNIKQKGVMSFEFNPPHDNSFLITQLWDKHMNPKWRESNNKKSDSAKEGGNIVEEIRKFTEEGKIIHNDKNLSTDNVTHVIVEHKVRAKKGKWTRFPPEVLNRRKNTNGEWEDIKSE